MHWNREDAIAHSYCEKRLINGSQIDVDDSELFEMNLELAHLVFCSGITAVEVKLLLWQDSRDSLLESTWHSNWPSGQVTDNINNTLWWSRDWANTKNQVWYLVWLIGRSFIIWCSILLLLYLFLPENRFWWPGSCWCSILDGKMLFMLGMQKILGIRDHFSEQA